MIRTILIDDERHALITLEHMLQKIEDIEILAIEQDSTKAVELINDLKPDLVFLDIEMPKMDGFALLEKFETLDFKVIFTTAYDQYAIKALKINALDYLLKPIDFEELQDSIKKYNENTLFTSESQIANLNQFKIDELSEILALSTSNGLEFIKIMDIMYFEGTGAYTYVIMNDQSKHLISKTLSNFEEVLDDNPLFFRAHKSYLVNLKYITKYIRGEGGELIMPDDKYIPLSRNKKQEFLNFFNKI